MALKIRLRQLGSKNNQTYRIIVADEKTRRDGKYLEKLGFYTPYLEEKNCSLDGERLRYWLDLGAQMSDQVAALAARSAPEVLKKYREDKAQLKMQKIIKKREKKQAQKG